MLTNSYGDNFLVSRSDLDWQSELLVHECEYDCFVLNTRNWLSVEQIRIVAMKLARSTCMWVEVFGCNSKLIHDAIDEASADIGRQSKIGDGDPMTTWNEKPMTEAEFASYVWTGGQGTSDWKLILVIGEEDAERRLSAAIDSVASCSTPPEPKKGSGEPIKGSGADTPNIG